MHICATDLLCGVVISEGSDQERLSFMQIAELNLLADVSFKTLKARPGVRVTTLLRKVFNASV